MSVLKFLNPGKRKLSLLSREEVEKLDRKVPGTNTNSNRTVTEAKKRAKTTVKVKEDTRAANRRISKQLADEATERMAAKRERLLKGIQERPVSLQLSDAYASSHGEIKDGNQAFLDKAMSWYGLSNGLGLATNISDRWRATPSFANFVGRSTPEAMAMAGSLVANPVGTILGMGTGHLGSQAGGYVGELLGNREAGEIAGSLVGMPFGYKAGTTLQRTVPRTFFGNTRGITVNGEEVSHNIPRPGTWLSDRSVVDVSGPEVTLSRRKLRRMFNKTKRDVSRYVHGEEFKDRVMNTKQFTEQDYKDLLTEIDDYLRKTKFKGVLSETGATNAPWGRNLPDGTVDFTKFDITMHPTHSTALHRANAWHEIWHSLGGNAAPSSYPQLYKLQKFNESINPQKLSKAMERAEDPTLETQLIQQGASPRAAQRFVQYERGDERGRSWFEEEIALKPREVRSRMQATLDRFRLLGYDTRQLINNPSLFKLWVNAEMHKGTNFSWDIGHLLQTYNINDLANYASKMLTTTGAAYLGSQQMLNNSKE